MHHLKLGARAGRSKNVWLVREINYLANRTFENVPHFSCQLDGATNFMSTECNQFA